jgi:hypothetical protein
LLPTDKRAVHDPADVDDRLTLSGTLAVQEGDDDAQAAMPPPTAA